MEVVLIRREPFSLNTSGINSCPLDGDRVAPVFLHSMAGVSRPDLGAANPASLLSYQAENA